jgi:phage shock protein C
MQRIIQINIAGRLISIEENAYSLLNEYITSLERHFANQEGKDEIIQDIENRIAELFSIAMQSGAVAISKADVQKVIDTLGRASELGESLVRHLPVKYTAQQQKQEQYDREHYGYRRIYRDPNDKLLGGVCSGLAKYFDIDPTIMRLIVVILTFIFLVGVVAYIIAWIVIPIARTPNDMNYMHGGEPMNIHRMARNMQDELQDLRKRAEQMSRELRDFFSRK